MKFIPPSTTFDNSSHAARLACSFMARAPGLEPGTCGLEGRRDYGRPGAPQLLTLLGQCITMCSQLIRLENNR